MPRVGAQGRQVWGAGSSSGDEDTPGRGAEGGQATEQVFERYLTELGGDHARDDPMFVRGVGKVRQYLASAEADSSACLICLGTIKPTEAVWSCRASCYVVLHMTCMQEWARSQIDTCVLKTMNRLSQFPGAAAEARATAEWGCPKCRQPYPASAVPRTYTCFCGKVEDPEWDPWRTAHSCGDLCGRALASEGGEGTCDHTCLLLCHPGPCPPCPLVMDATCYCGARHDRRRCGHHEFSCGGECCARLLCGHVCRNACHPGECMPCDMQVKSQCQCGAETRLLPCSERDFQCGRVCGKALSCGNHACERTCHAGPCGACPSEGARTCPCGQVTYTGLSCMEKATPCGGTCGKMLPCGQHTCQDRCHPGECSSCRATVTKACRCGKSQKAVPCAQELLCDRRCNATRACGRHPCKRRCCAGGNACPPCEEVCGRKLRCGNHRCPAPCHPGPCRPCPLTVGFSCACGRVTATLPCGAEARAVPPRCPAPCAVPSLCRHAPAPTHRCHYGPCPPCTNACGTLLGCGHACGSAACHDPPPPAVAAFVPPTAPKVHLSASSMLEHLGNGFGADTRTAASARVAVNRPSASGQQTDGQGTSRVAEPPAAAAAAVAQAQLELGLLGGKLASSCPPCVVPVEVSCFGSHERTREACCLAKAYQCKQPCGQMLACGNHMCQLPCHVTAASAGVSGGAPTPCQACTQACGRPRACGHACDQPCHATPCPPCSLSVRTPCHCGKASLSLSCVALCAARAATATNSHATGGSSDALCCGKPCHRPLPNCPHPCRAPCHAGACPGATQCDEEVTVRCACKRLKAKWPCHQVASALQESGRPAAYDATTTLRLLPCDTECATAAAVGAQSKPRGGSTAAAAGSDTTSQSKPNGAAKVVPAGGVAAAGGNGTPVLSKPKLTRAEREAEAARREQERALQAARAKRWSQVKTALVWAVIVLLGLLLGVGVPRMMGD